MPAALFEMDADLLWLETRIVIGDAPGLRAQPFFLRALGRTGLVDLRVQSFQNLGALRPALRRGIESCHLIPEPEWQIRIDGLLRPVPRRVHQKPAHEREREN